MLWDSYIVWENRRRSNIFTYAFHLAVYPPGAPPSCPVGLVRSCFMDASLCCQLTQYQHLASENSLARTSIIQPSLPKGQAERDESIWRHAGAVGIICPCVNERPASYRYILSWEEQGGRTRLKEVKQTVPAVGNSNATRSPVCALQQNAKVYCGAV